jgi:hypothetical protein
MATSTIVITYTAGSGSSDEVVTSLTEGGTAFASLTQAQCAKVYRLCEQAAKVALKGGSAATQATHATQGIKNVTS